MYIKYFERLADRNSHPQEALLPEDVLPNLKSHQYQRLKETLVIHAGILGLHTFLFAIAWKSSVQNYCPFQYTGEIIVSGSVDLSNYLLLSQLLDLGARAIEYIRTTIDINSPNPFKGDPTMKVNHA